MSSPHAVHLEYEANQETYWSCICGDDGRYKSPGWEEQPVEWLRHVPDDDADGVAVTL